MRLTMRENKRLKVIHEVIARIKTIKEASLELGLSKRQIYRIKPRVKKNAVFGIIHGNRGRANAFKISDDIRKRILDLRRSEYLGFNDRHFTDELRDVEKIKIGRESVRKILRLSGIPATRKTKHRKHRRRRTPMERFGEMLQGDASSHDWLESRGHKFTLVHFVDDATNHQWANFFYTETTEGYFRVLLETLTKHGIPRCLYVDNHGIFKVNIDNTKYEQETGRKPLTQFKRAMEELAINVIYAESPQAKGRVERRGGLDQDRLVSELRKANAKTIDEARIVLKKYLKKSNQRFTKQPASKESAFIKLPENCDLKQILCWKEERTATNDNTISFHGKTLQIPPSANQQSYAKAKVAVHLCLDESVHVFHKKLRIAYFKKTGVDPAIVPIFSINRATLANHSPSLTFSLGH